MTGIVAIRRLTTDDIDAVANIHRLSFDERMPWLSGRHTREEDRQFFRETVFPQCDLWGAIDHGRIAGFVAMRDGWIDHLYVLPEFQSRGVGSILLRHCQTQAQELQLWTFQQNAGARRFYEAHGFDLMRTTQGAENDEKEPDALYRWHRTPGLEPTTLPDADIGA